MARSLRRLAIVVSWVGGLASCGTVGPDWHPPAAPAAARYTEAPLPDAAGFDAAAPAPDRWSTLFGSAVLDALVEQALVSSPTLEQASARLREAEQEFAAQAHSARWPQAELALSTSRQRNDPSVSGIAGVPGSVFSLHGATLDVRYAFDIAGGSRRRVEALGAGVDQAAHRRDAARAMLAANVVAAVLQAAATQEQLRLLDAALAVQAQRVEITERQVGLGGAAPARLHAERALLAQTQGRLPPLRQQHAAARHRLALYLGRTPAQGLAPLPRWDTLQTPPTLPVGVPADLTRRRPDVQAAEAALHEASARIGVAAAQLYPQLSIGAGLGSQRQHAADLAAGLNLWSVGLRLAQPLLDRPALKARQAAAVAAYDAALASHRETVLHAVAEVADALHAVHESAQQLQARTREVDEARARDAIAQAQWRLGGISHLESLDAQRQALQASLDRLATASAHQLHTVALLQALGGGWNAGISASHQPFLPAAGQGDPPLPGLR